MFNRKEYTKKYLVKYRQDNINEILLYNLLYKEANKEKLKHERKSYTQKNMAKIKEVVRANKLKIRYGITPGDYDYLLKKQKGKCAICKSVASKLGVDHCHQSSRVRGLLCGGCNRGIGLFKENINSLKSAVAYLQK